MSAARLDRAMVFEAPVRADNGAGGARTGWREVFRAFCEVRYQRGREDEQAGGLAATARYKVRLRSTPDARALTGQHTMRDLQSGMRYNLREIDALSDRAHVWLVAEAGVAS